jgi:hypothetical protein
MTIEHAHCMLDTKRYRHTLSIRNILAFPLLQWLHERASMLRDTTLPVFLLFISKRGYYAENKLERH